MGHIFPFQPGSAGSSMSTYRIVPCRWQTGERYCLLVDETGLPLWSPALFATTQIRAAGSSVATMETALRSIQILLAYADDRGISIEERIRARKHLAMPEVHGLADWAQRSFDRRRPLNGRGRRPPTVARDQHYIRLTWIAQYVKWLAQTLLTITPDDTAAIERVAKSILARRPRSRSGSSIRDRALTDEQYDRLLEVIRPDHPDNPFPDRRTAGRNELIVHLLLQLGIRRGELLGIQVGDIDWQGLSLAIHRRPDDPHDPRTDQPRAKTLARTLALSHDLIERTYHYVSGPRRQTKGAGSHRYLIIAHGKGPYQGDPLSHAALSKVFAALRRCDPLLEGLHPHIMRHTWNSKFSQALDARPADERPTEAQEVEVRSHHMGWIPGSGTAALYNQRHITKRANEAAQRMYEKAGLNRPGGNSNA